MGDLPFDEGQDCGGWVIRSPRKEWSGSSPSPRLEAWGSRGGSYWTGRVCMRSGYGGHVRGFIPRDGGSPSRIETHGEVPRITGVFDDSGTVRTGFPT